MPIMVVAIELHHATWRQRPWEREVVATVTDIGELITQRPTVRRGRPIIAGTSVSVNRVVRWYKQGVAPEEIGRRIGHLSPAQVYAALTYYYANREAVEADMAAEDAEADELEREWYQSRREQR